MNVLVDVLLTVLVFAVIIIIHEGGHFIMARLMGIRVNEFSAGMGPKLLSRKRGDTLYSLRAFPIGGFCAMEGEQGDSTDENAFCNKAVWRRIFVVIAGALMNLLLGFFIIFIMTISAPQLESKTVSVVAEQSAAAAAGLQPGDILESVNGNKLFIANDFLTELRRSDNGVATIGLWRDGKYIELKNVDFKIEEEGSKKLAVGFSVYELERNPLSLTGYAAGWTISTGRLIFSSLIDLFSGKYSITDFSGPVGTSAVISQVRQTGARNFFFLVAFMTINVGLFNLLPIPALDGGRLVFLLIEAIRRKPVNPKYENAIHLVSFFLLMGFIVLITYNDIIKLFA